MATAEAEPAAADGEGSLLPPELSDITALTDEEFEQLGPRLRDCADRKDVQGLDNLVAAALWDEAAVERRLTPTYRELLSLMLELLQGTSGTLEDHLRSFTRPVLCAIWRMSNTPDMGRVRVQWGKAGAPCVLILGFAGSSVDEMKPQEDYYRSLGFSTCVSTLVCYPTRILQRQHAQIGNFLREGLKEEGTKLLVHSASGHGFNFFENLVRLWRKGSPPCDGLPPLRERFAAFVIECFAPGAFFDKPETTPGDKVKDGDGAALEPAGAGEEDWGVLAEQLVEEAATGFNPVFFGAACNTLNTLTEKHMPEARWWSVMGKHKELSLLLRSLEPSHGKMEDGAYGSGFIVWGPNPAWTALEMEMSHANGMNVPRLFLYSTKDGLIPYLMVEGAIDYQWTLMSKQTKILVEKCTKSAHCKLWVTERSACEKAVTKLLKAAKLKKV